MPAAWPDSMTIDPTGGSFVDPPERGPAQTPAAKAADDQPVEPFVMVPTAASVPGGDRGERAWRRPRRACLAATAASVPGGDRGERAGATAWSDRRHTPSSMPHTAGTAQHETRYALSGDTSIACQVVGEGPFDLILVPGFVSNVEYGWEEPHLASFYERLASFCRLVIFDKRGTGASDRVRGVPTLDERVDDVRAIMDAIGSSRAALIGYSEGASMAAFMASSQPERVAALIMYGSYLGWDWMADGRFPTRHQSDAAALDEIGRRWGTPDYCDELLANDAPSMLADPEFRRWYATRLRLSASPSAAVALQRMNLQTDTRALLPSIRVPTLIVHRLGDRNVDIKNARFAADAIPGARSVELPGDDHLPWVGDSESIIGVIRGSCWSSAGQGHGSRPRPTASSPR
jgi:pimeloyl-ACP methyl ester carboxylesterase